jgi:hypothetical protein
LRWRGEDRREERAQERARKVREESERSSSTRRSQSLHRWSWDCSADSSSASMASSFLLVVVVVVVVVVFCKPEKHEQKQRTLKTLTKSRVKSFFVFGLL